jgi:hypothetical protein
MQPRLRSAGNCSCREQEKALQHTLHSSLFGAVPDAPILLQRHRGLGQSAHQRALLIGNLKAQQENLDVVQDDRSAGF